jgi:hypothetical protein
MLGLVWGWCRLTRSQKAPPAAAVKPGKDVDRERALEKVGRIHAWVSRFEFVLFVSLPVTENVGSEPPSDGGTFDASAQLPPGWLVESGRVKSQAVIG